MMEAKCSFPLAKCENCKYVLPDVETLETKGYPDVRYFLVKCLYEDQCLYVASTEKEKENEYGKSRPENAGK